MVGAAYLQIMVINGATKSYSDAPKDDALFKAAGDAARPFLVSNEKKDEPEHHDFYFAAGPARHARQRAILLRARAV